jgi:predicted dienelactone hydrolase
MKRPVVIAAVLAIVAAIGFLVFAPPHPRVAVEDVSVPDPEDKPLEARVWYPRAAPAARLPLVVISHGTGGGMTMHADTAIALAEAGFIVVAPTHTGDNYRDDSYVGRGLHLIGRPRHIARVVDYALGRGFGAARVDRDRIGLFGHSAGGFTALVVAGAEPDLTGAAARCRRRPPPWDCTYLKSHGIDLTKPRSRPPAPKWLHDSRIRAIAIAAPAVGYSFERNGLASVRVPVQLWIAGHDAIVEDSPDIVARLLPPPGAEAHRIREAGHLSFLAPCDWRMRAIMAAMRRGVLNICTDEPGFDRARFHARLNRQLVGFFRRTLR